jgi:hypothetical protein
MPPFKQRRFFSKENKLLVPIVILSISILVLVISSQVLIEASLDDIRADANYAGLMGKQRALSQQIVKDIVIKDWAKLPARELIDSLLNIVIEQNKILCTGDKSLGIKPLPPELVPAYNKMLIVFDDFANTVRKRETNKNTPQSFLTLVNEQEKYSRELDSYSAAIANNTNKEVNAFYSKAVWIMIARVAIVSLEVFFIFLPAVRRIQSQNDRLKAIAYHQSHIVRSPVCSILGILPLIAEAEEKDKIKELVNMATIEAERLDNIIKETVSLTYKA